MTERECIYLISRMQTIGPVSFDRLTALYGNAGNAWKERNPPLPGKVLEEWQRFHSPETEIRLCRELERLPKRNLRFLIREDEDFPASLKLLPDCPTGLWLRGRLPAPGTPAAAVIGARRCTEYGKSQAMAFGAGLAAQGVAVVSGMALGIDAWGQRGALDAGGYSLAVLGSGVDVCYPASHRNLYERLAEQGGILSEYGPGEPGLPFHFPMRNRLISGLARIVLVIEAREKSGSLITVDQALEQGKEVFALPGRLGDPLSEGCNRLIAQGAGILTGLEPVLQVLGLSRQAMEEEKKPLIEKLSDTERRVLSCLGNEPVHTDEISARTGCPVRELLVILWRLEHLRLCRSSGPSTYIRR